MNQHARLQPEPVPFIDLAAQRRALGAQIDAAIARVMEHCQFILGPEVQTLEARLSEFCGARHAVSCASGTDALALVLMAKEIGPGDAVICPAFTFCAPAEMVALLGATPVFADVDETTFSLSVESTAEAIACARSMKLTPKAIIAVDLFGLPADYDAITALAQAEGLFVLDDAAQGFGATYKGHPVGTFGNATATSFFPAKPLGCYGDGGAVMTDDDALADILKSLRMHGHGADRYDHVRIGMNGRLDTIQAAVLLAKLDVFPQEIAARNAAARRYEDALADLVAVPRVPPGLTSVWAQYTIRLQPGRRDGFAAAMKAQGIPTAVHYPQPLHQQTAYRHYPRAAETLPIAERLATEVISLPMHAYLDDETQTRIIAAARQALGA
ncbi:MAG: DegT/DnrJ/EryC1/StrS family aminotransferase [Xanthobacteraceae bacterium]